MEEKLEETLRKLAAGQERLENRTEDLAAAVRELTGVVRELAERQANTDKTLGELSTRTERRFEEMASAIGELTRQAARHDSALAELSARTERRFEEMASAIGELTRVVRELSEHAARTDMRLEEVDRKLEKIDKRLEDVHLVATLISIDQRASSSKLDLVVKGIEDLDGVVLESKVKDQLHNLLKDEIRDLKVLDKYHISQILSSAENKGVLTNKERGEVGQADVFAVGVDKNTGDVVCVAAEVSSTVHVKDVTRAEVRSKLFAKAVKHYAESETENWIRIYPKHPRIPKKEKGVVIGKWISKTAEDVAKQKGIGFYRIRKGPNMHEKLRSIKNAQKKLAAEAILNPPKREDLFNKTKMRQKINGVDVANNNRQDLSL